MRSLNNFLLRGLYPPAHDRQTFHTDFLAGLHKWQRHAGDLALPAHLVYGGDDNMGREGVAVHAWHGMQHTPGRPTQRPIFPARPAGICAPARLRPLLLGSSHRDASARQHAIPEQRRQYGRGALHRGPALPATAPVSHRVNVGTARPVLGS